jgi:hypothetical protein
MSSDFHIIAQGNAQVGAQFGVANDPVTVTFGDRIDRQVKLDRADLLDMLAEFRCAVIDARSGGRLSEHTSAVVLRHLDTANLAVDSAAKGETAGLSDILMRIKKVLPRTIDLIAKLTAIVAAVQSIR